jgi:hypothetical protein
VINASRISLEGTVELICGLARSPRFTITSETLAKIEALCRSDEEVVGMMPQGEETVAGYFAAVIGCMMQPTLHRRGNGSLSRPRRGQVGLAPAEGDFGQYHGIST